MTRNLRSGFSLHILIKVVVLPVPENVLKVSHRGCNQKWVNIFELKWFVDRATPASKPLGLTQVDFIFYFLMRVIKTLICPRAQWVVFLWKRPCKNSVKWTESKSWICNNKLFNHRWFDNFLSLHLIHKMMILG